MENNEKLKKNKGLFIILITCIVLFTLLIIYLKFFIKDVNTNTNTNTNVTKFTSEYELQSSDLSDFDIYFMKEENNERNMLYSPLSIKYALSMLSLAANGNTKSQIDATLGKYTPKKYTNNANYSLANVMFIKNTFKESIKEDYVKNLNDKFNASVYYDDFTSPYNVNSWVSDNTYKLVNNMFDDIKVNDYLLVNALAINMDWKYLIQPIMKNDDTCNTYDKKHNSSCIDWRVFYNNLNVMSMYVPAISEDDYKELKFNEDQTVKSLEFAASINNYDAVNDIGKANIEKTITEEYNKWVSTKPCGDYEYEETSSFVNNYIKELDANYKDVASSTDFSLYEDENVKVFAKSLKEYNTLNLEYIAIMPKTVKLNDYIKNLKAVDLKNIVSSLKTIDLDNFENGFITKVTGTVPLFKFDYELNLKEDLINLGIKDAFDGNADLSNLSSSKTIIDKAVHKANIEFSNEGIKAAAATGIGGLGATGCGFSYTYDAPVKEIDLTFNKPFMFLIRDSATNEIWFTGTVYNPTSK